MSLAHIEVRFVPAAVEINGTGVGVSNIDCSGFGKAAR
jgi:hypothetical protein